MNVAVFGLGYVGCVSVGCLAENGHHVVGVDLHQAKVAQINGGRPTIVEPQIGELVARNHAAGRIRATDDGTSAVRESDLSIVCVGTPSSATGQLDLSAVFAVARQIGAALAGKTGYHLIAIRSTVFPGTCERVTELIEEASGKRRGEGFSVVANPEFLREGTAVADYYNPPYTLIGADSERAAQGVAALYEQIDAEVIVSEVPVAEVMKYVNNTFHALKVSFANEIGNLCQALGIDSHRVMDIFVKDTQLNIAPYYLKPGFAYGGSCLPKDLRALQTLAHDHYVVTPVISSIEQTNHLQISRAIEMVGRLPGRRVGVLGLSFKAGTDDLRNSPAVALVEALLGKGYELEIFDQDVRYSMLTATNKEFIDQHLPHLIKLLNEDIEEIIERAEMVVVTKRNPRYLPHLQKLQDKPLIDLVRLDESLLTKANYHGISW